MFCRNTRSGRASVRKVSAQGEDLYGAAAIRQAAQNVFVLTIEDPEGKDRLDLLDVEIKMDKQREGRVGKVNCYFDRDHLLFTYPQQKVIT